jgi:hypothetical protein
MDIVIQEYLNLRQDFVIEENLITAKPKHHMLSHYSLLYKRFGPLIMCWTMRFESKHRFFKDVANKAKNFIHFLKMACSRHQRFQGHLFHCGVFKPEFVMPENAVPLDGQNVALKVQTELTKQIVSMAKTVSTNPFLSNSLLFRGTRYTVDQFIVLFSDPDNLQLHFGKILKGVISNTGSDIYFIVRLYIAENSGHGFYYVDNAADLHLVNIIDLADYVPLSLLHDSNKVVLHHFVSKRE